MNTLFKIVFAGLFATVVNCSNKYKVVGIPKLHYLCQQVVEKDFYNKADQLFALVGKRQLDEADDQKLQKLLEYNAYLQNNPYVQINIQLPSLLNLAQNNSGDTPLHWSAYGNAEKITAQLLAAGAHVDAQNNSGDTPLHFSAFNNAGITTKQLLAARATIDAKNNNCRTPLHFSVLIDAEKTTQLLLAAGADVYAQDDKDCTPLSLASSPEIKNLLVPAKSICLIS
jgi:ankyrin repeat protein